MTYKGPIRMARLDIVAAVPVQTQIQCANCLRLLIGKQKLRCTACRQSIYCSQNCQENHWKTHHKAECGKFSSPFENIQLRVSDRFPGLSPADHNLLIIFQVPSACNTLSVMPFSQYSEEKQFARCLIYCQNINIQFSSEFNTFLAVEAADTIYYRCTSGDGGAVVLSDSFDFSTTKKEMYDGLKLICTNCKGPVDPNELRCLKCGSAREPAPEDKKLQALLDWYQRCAEYQLLFQGQDHVQARKSGICLKRRLSEKLDGQCASGKELVSKFCGVLKMNIFHHLSYGLYIINSYVFRLLRQLSGAAYHDQIDRFLAPVDIYSLSFAFLKASVQHFTMLHQVTYDNLLLIVQILNSYTLSQLEACGAPPLMKEYDGALEISPHERQRMQAIATKLLPGHHNCLAFAQQLIELVEQLKDEQLQNEAQGLIGQIDCRVENLESWVSECDEGNDAQGLFLQGDRYTGDSANSGGQEIDIIK